MIEELKIKLTENPSLYLFLIVIGLISIFLLFLLLKSDKKESNSKPSQDNQKRNKKEKSSVLKSSKTSKSLFEKEEFKEDISEVPLPLMESAPPVLNKKPRKITLSKIKPVQLLNKVEKIETKDIILIVDDSNLSLKKLKKDIGSVDKYEIVTASDAFEAIEYLKNAFLDEIKNQNKEFNSNNENKKIPSLVISDIEMPLNEKGEGDGFFLLNHIKQEYGEEFPVILMTSNLDIFNERGMEEGANGFLNKPFDKEIILEQIDFCLKN